MIWLRRTTAVLLGAALIPTLFASLVLLQLNTTFLSPSYYPDRLARSDVYRFVMVDVLTSAIDEVRQPSPGDFGGGFDASPIAAYAPSTPQIVDAVNSALSPEDLEELVAPAALRIGEYVAAERDDLTITVQAGKSVKAVARELGKLVGQASDYDLFLDQELEPRIREGVGEALAADGNASRRVRHLFGSPEDAADRLAQGSRRIVTPEWLQAQVEQALDEVTPYLVGESDGFEIRVRLTDEQVRAASEEIRAILREVDAYDLVYAELIEPAVRDSVGAGVSLPYGVEITEDELVGLLRQAAPPEWVEMQAETLIYDVVAYATGGTDGFSTEVSLTGNKADAEEAVADLVAAKLSDLVRGLPACRTRSETLAAVDSMRRGLPACIPEGRSAAGIIEEVVPRATGSVLAPTLALVPGRISFTESSLRSGLRLAGRGEGALEAFDEIRSLIADGYVYTHEDLRADLAGRGGALETLDEARSLIADGYVYTHEYGDRPASRTVRALDAIHGTAAVVRRYGWTVYVLTSVLIIAAGLLGGRSWPARAAWASMVLLISAGAAFAAVGPLYDASFAPGFDRAHANIAAQPGGDFRDTLLLISDKVLEVFESIGSDFVGGIRQTSLILALAASAVLLAALFRARKEGVKS